MDWIVDLLPGPWSAIVLAVLVAALGATTLLADDRRFRDIARERFLWGVPWGTATTVVLVTLFYLVAQDGWADWSRPVAYPFIAWSYFYPLGQLTAGFAHASPGHLVSNLLGTAVFGTIAEYGWGHYPADRDDWPRHSGVRAFVCVPVATGVVAVVTTAFAWGPVIGFSGAVFALTGVAVVRYPIVTIIAQVVRSAIIVVGEALLEPVAVHEVTSTVEPPGWAGISVQGHALGFILGALVGLWLLYRRAPIDGPSPRAIWIGVTLVGATSGLWALSAAPAEDVYVLYRGAGVAGLLVLATVVAAASQAPDRPLRLGVTPRHVLVCLLVLPLLVMAVVAVPMGLLTVSPHDVPEQAVTVGDYAVYYETDHELAWQPGVDVPAIPGAGTNTTQSGLFVSSAPRQLHLQAASSAELARTGETTVTVGGLDEQIGPPIGWRADLQINRSGWVPVGNESVYRIVASHDGESRTLYTAPGRQAEIRIDGHRIEVVTTDTGFGIQVHEPAGAVYELPVPTTNDTVAAGELAIHRDDDELVVEHDDTRATVASQE